MLKIPEILNNRINTNLKFQANVSKIISCNFVEILKESNQPLFAEYTNHKLSHNQAVLDYMCSLIPDKLLKNLSDDEILVLLYSNILHDLAMHITFDGLHTLLKSNIKNSISNKTWDELWKLYAKECKSLPTDIYRRLFQSNDNIGLIENSASLTKEELLICGEFIRKYHGDIANFISINGYPIANGKFVKVDFSEMNDIKEISGLVAMSHCYSLRKMDFILKNKYGDPRYECPYGFHIYYLMGVLRIADYLHAGWDRAPFIINDSNNWISKISQCEWNWNEAINPHFYWNYARESLDIMASIDKASIFFKVKEWLQNVQKELDYTWAVILEKYGNMEKQWGFSIRRITSPVIDNPKMYEDKFYTTPICLDCNTEKIQLLLSSFLYNNNPNIAIRELLQNAIDACLIRKAKDGESYSPLVYVHLYSDGLIIIKDNGIGMDIEDIKNNLLSKGVSNKKNLYEKNDLILQNGEFGIGFLSIFMLGNEIEIKTRKYERNQGLVFNLKNNIELIDVNKCNCDVGTTIRIKLKDTIENLKLVHIWDGVHKEILEYPYMEYYYLNDPKVIYTHDYKEIKRNLYYDDDDDGFFGLPAYYRETEFSIENWNKLDGEELYWKFSEESFCYLNGFKMYLKDIAFDNISIVLFDIEHKCKYNLARDRINDFPYYEKVINDIKENIICNIVCGDYILKHSLYSDCDCRLYTEKIKLDAPVCSDSQYTLYAPDFLFGKNGFSLVVNNRNIDTDKKVYLVFIKGDLFNKQDFSFVRNIQKYDSTFIVVQPLEFELRYNTQYKDLFYNVKTLFIIDNPEILNGVKYNGEIINLSQLDYHPLLDIDQIIKNKDKIMMIIEFDNYMCLSESIDFKISNKVVRISKYIKQNDLGLIPYDMNQRKKKFENYFKIYEKRYRNISPKFCITTIRLFLY